MQARVAVTTVEDVSKVTGPGSLTNQMVTGANTNSQGFYLVDQNSQLVATVSNLIPGLEPIRIQTNTAAAATVILKMELDVQEGRSINQGDIVTLVGDVAGVVATVAFFAAAPEVALIATAVAVSADLTGIITSAEQSSIATFTNSFASDYFTSTPAVPTNGTYYLTADNQIMTAEEIAASGQSYGALVVTPDGTEIAAASTPVASFDDEDIDGTGNGDENWGDDGYGDDQGGDDDGDDQGDDYGDDDAMDTQDN
jgi:hypothetical protein